MVQVEQFVQLVEFGFYVGVVICIQVVDVYQGVGYEGLYCFMDEGVYVVVGCGGGGGCVIG